MRRQTDGGKEEVDGRESIKLKSHFLISSSLGSLHPAFKKKKDVFCQVPTWIYAEE